MRFAVFSKSELVLFMLLPAQRLRKPKLAKTVCETIPKYARITSTCFLRAGMGVTSFCLSQGDW